MYLGFTGIQHDVPFNLNADNEPRRSMFPSGSTEFKVDFAATSKKGIKYHYEIIAHPDEDPEGLEKILMFQEQHTNERLIIISGPRFDSVPFTTKSYHDLESAFAERIRRAGFAGWEIKGYNLKTHPEVFSR